MKTTKVINTRNLILSALLLIILSLYSGFLIGKNQNSEPNKTTTSQNNTSKSNDGAVVLTKGITSTSGGGATLTGQVKNRLETTANITLVGSFQNTWGDEITATNTEIDVPANSTSDYTISFGPEVAGFASFDVKVTEVK